MTVLLIAEQANPEWVSVPLIGWSLYRAISEITECHVVTQVRNRDAFLRQGLIEGKDFTAIDSEYIAAKASKFAEALRGGDGKGWTTVTAFQSLAYYAFEYALWSNFESRIAAGEFRIVHRITPLSPTTPSIIAKRCAAHGVPFILGPLNGGLRWPKGFEDRRIAERDWLSYARSFYRLLPGRNTMLRYASRILVGSEATAAEIPRRFRGKVVHIAENAVDPIRFCKARTQKTVLPLQGVFVGRLVPYKCPDVLIRAGADLIRSGHLRLKFVGDGPMRLELDALVSELGLNDGIEFAGWIKHSEIQDTLIQNDVLVLPSIREFGGGVVLEAMACGVPPVVADYGGPAELVVMGTGIKVPFSDAESLRRNLELVFHQLIEDPTSVDTMSRKAREHVLRNLTWAAKAQRIVAQYDKCGATKE